MKNDVGDDDDSVLITENVILFESKMIMSLILLMSMIVFLYTYGTTKILISILVPGQPGRRKDFT